VPVFFFEKQLENQPSTVGKTFAAADKKPTFASLYYFITYILT